MADSVMSFPKTKKGELLEITRSCLKTDLYMHFKETEKVREEYEAVKLRASGLASRKPRWSDMLRNIINEYDLQFHIEAGNDEGAEQFYLCAFEKAENALSRVTAKYNLWLYYSRREEKQKAERALKYAGDNGNKLYIAQEARRILSELSDRPDKVA